MTCDVVACSLFFVLRARGIIAASHVGVYVVVGEFNIYLKDTNLYVDTSITVKFWLQSHRNDGVRGRDYLYMCNLDRYHQSAIGNRFSAVGV